MIICLTIMCVIHIIGICICIALGGADIGNNSIKEIGDINEKN